MERAAAGSAARSDATRATPLSAPVRSATGAPESSAEARRANAAPAVSSGASTRPGGLAASPVWSAAISGIADRNRCAGESMRLRSWLWYIDRSPTTTVATPIAIIAGGSISRLSVISATISSRARGACATLPNRATMPTITNGAGDAGRSGAIGRSRRQIAAPSRPPTTIPGPNTPPDPPDPMVSEVARIFANGRAMTTHSGMSRSASRSSPACTHP